MAGLVEVLLGWIHLLAVVFWIGGAIFFDAILHPSLRSLAPDQAGRLSQAVVKRFTPLVWGAIITVAATGLLRAGRLGALSPWMEPSLAPPQSLPTISEHLLISQFESSAITLTGMVRWGHDLALQNKLIDHKIR